MIELKLTDFDESDALKLIYPNQIRFSVYFVSPERYYDESLHIQIRKDDSPYKFGLFVKRG